MKIVYVALFTFLGILLQLLVHGLFERWYIGLLVSDFSKYGLGLSWGQWFTIHQVGTVVLFIAGALFGFWQGKFWWRKIYEKKEFIKMKKKGIIELVIIFLIVWTGFIVIHELFLNLEYGVLRSFILGVGAAASYHIIKQDKLKKSKLNK